MTQTPEQRLVERVTHAPDEVSAALAAYGFATKGEHMTETREATTSTTTQNPPIVVTASPPVIIAPPPAKGFRTSEFWIIAALMAINYLAVLLQGTQGGVGVVASIIANAIGSSAYAISRGIVKARRPTIAALLMLLAVASGASCAHTPLAVSTCAEQLTLQLEGTATHALAVQDYEGAITREFAGVAACLVVAAVEAAVDQAKHLKLAGDVDQAAVARHGDAWLTAHRTRASGDVRRRQETTRG